jgi:hypothetical protein
MAISFFLLLALAGVVVAFIIATLTGIVLFLVQRRNRE